MVRYEESVDEEDFENLGFCIFWILWALVCRIFVYTTSMVKGGDSAKHTSTFLCAVYTRYMDIAAYGLYSIICAYVRRPPHSILWYNLSQYNMVNTINVRGNIVVRAL